MTVSIAIAEEKIVLRCARFYSTEMSISDVLAVTAAQHTSLSDGYGFRVMGKNTRGLLVGGGAVALETENRRWIVSTAHPEKVTSAVRDQNDNEVNNCTIQGNRSREMTTPEQGRHVMLHGWSGLLTLAIALTGVAMIFMSPLRELLGPLWTGYPAIAFGYIFLGVPAIHRYRLRKASQGRSLQGYRRRNSRVVSWLLAMGQVGWYRLTPQNVSRPEKILVPLVQQARTTCYENPRTIRKRGITFTTTPSGSCPSR